LSDLREHPDIGFDCATITGAGATYYYYLSPRSTYNGLRAPGLVAKGNQWEFQAAEGEAVHEGKEAM
jgi:hypothetical protein